MKCYEPWEKIYLYIMIAGEKQGILDGNANALWREEEQGPPHKITSLRFYRVLDVHSLPASAWRHRLPVTCLRKEKAPVVLIRP